MKLEIKFNNYTGADLNDPRFDMTNKCHDWRNYVPEEIIKIWEDLSAREKLIVAAMAEQRSDTEVWD